MQKILEGVSRFQERVFEPRRELFESLSRHQQPQACFITCADSRVDPQLITGCDPGELFVVRNAGNLVPPYGTDNNSEAASVEFALSLGVRDVIVCGHSHCGAMTKLLAPDAGSADTASPWEAVGDWLRHADETKRRLRRLRRLGARSNHEDRIWQAVQQNVLVQLEHLRSFPGVAAGLRAGTLTLHGWAYRIETGDVLSYDESECRFAPLAQTIAY